MNPSRLRPLCLLPDLAACPFRLDGHCCHGVRRLDGPCPLATPVEDSWPGDTAPLADRGVFDLLFDMESSHPFGS
jgi:hypothetical protein